MIVIAIVAILLLTEQTICQVNEGTVSGNRPRMISQARVFDLPKFAPTARIIKLSRSLRRKHHKDDTSVFSDAAGSFDNFEAFDLEGIDGDASSGEAKGPTRSRDGSSNRKRVRSEEEDNGEFFPEN
ncbi:hypothetical protein V3C99_011029 [Haemonchus contortus]|uniref:RxLR effector protein n=1 Tax=Haemonchus contortus TaxID=6289 RepID=A0A7I4Y5R1_HAECO|nr:unnamed protein product [Haemonchus contortus]